MLSPAWWYLDVKMNANKLWRSSESKYRFKFSIWSFAFSAELNPTLKTEPCSSRERVLPHWSKCCDLVSSLMKRKFLHKLRRFWQKYVSDVAKARMQLHYSALVSSPNVCWCTIWDRALGSPVCSLGLLAGHVDGDKAATAVACVQTRIKIRLSWYAVRWKLGQKNGWQSLLPLQNCGECRCWRKFPFPALP